MKTEALIDLLANGAGPAPRAVAARRLLPAALLGVLLSVVLALALLGPVPASMYATPAPWIKFGYALALAAAGGWLAARLSRPVARLGTPRAVLSAVLTAMALLAAYALLTRPAGERLAAVLGHSWLACPWNVLAFSLPALAAVLWAVRGLAPTRPRAAGCAAGLFAGALGAFGYALACTEDSTAFVAIWYSVGIGLTALLGALAGPRVLRW
ncbi:NrsF family protein [Quisquiliibacterium transsilvanicum]|uniref:DUF1109 domain-containing protein n=1 Tax=Quisquiliibacterium transsilvanicum TaxID=1549638 RepID=A0A7W8HK56_9BURK|nr:DUF1109 domain-containing protein [Quisquiliibacterium transsilvanicum]MBB5272693.1 hypothetical protein [Quisquiliibacterium transsilvanicum]